LVVVVCGEVWVMLVRRVMSGELETFEQAERSRDGIWEREVVDATLGKTWSKVGLYVEPGWAV
jgi:hypothetical protein